MKFVHQKGETVPYLLTPCTVAKLLSLVVVISIGAKSNEWGETRLLHNIPVIVQFSSVIHAERLSRIPWTLDYFQKKDGTTTESCCAVSFPKSLIFRQKSELFFCKQPKHILMHLPLLSWHILREYYIQPFSYMYIGTRVAGELGFF